jgi:hypothetical protein
MNKYLQVLVWGLLLLIYTTLKAKDVGVDKDHPEPPRKKVQAAAIPANAILEQQALAALNSQLQGFNISGTNVVYKSSASFLAESMVTDEVKTTRDSANTLMKKLDREDKFLDMDSPAAANLSPIKFPIGLKKHFGANNIVYVAFSRAVLKPNYAEITAFVKMEMYIEDGQGGSKKKRELFFGAEGIRITNNGKIVGDARLVLLGDYTIPMFNGKMKLVIRGGDINEANGGLLKTDKTFAILDCNGFREAGITADAIFDPAVLTPIDLVTAVEKQGNVTATLKVIGGLTDFNNILGTLFFNSGFYVTGHKKWGFAISKMYIDGSIKQNHSGIGYFTKYIGKHPGLKQNLKEEEWRGLGINSFKVFLPSEFRKRGTTNRITIAANNIIFDKYGASCDVGVENITNYKLDSGKTNATSAWKMSLDNFYLTFDQNKLVGGKFAGKILLPVSKQTSSAYGYSAIIDLKGQYSLSIINRNAVDFNIFKAKAVLTQSTVTLAVEADPAYPGNDRFKVSAELSGYMTLKNDTLEKSPTDTVKVAGQKTETRVTFQGMVLRTNYPHFTLASAGYSKQSNMANFPITVDNFNVSVSSAGAKTIAALMGGVNFNLMGGGAETDSTSVTGFSAKSAFKITAELDTTTEIHEWKYRAMTMKPAGLDAKISKYWFTGELTPFKDANKGTGLTASLIFKKKEKGAWTTMGSFLGVFGNIVNENFRYWLVEGYANVKVMTIGAVTLKGLGGSVYHHMYPSETEKDGITTELVKSDNIIPGQLITYRRSEHKLGFKAVVGLESTGKDYMKGMVGLELIFNKNWGVSSIGVFGNATLAADFSPGFKTPEFANKLKKQFGNLAKKATSNPVGTYLTKSKLIAKGKDEFNGGDTTKVGNSGTIAMSVALNIDFDNDNLHGDGAVYVNSAPMRGIHPNGLAGKFVLHFDKKEWYIHAGNPSERIGLSMGLGPVRMQASTYIMVGHRIPPMPPPPPVILALLGPSYKAATPARDETAINSGVGIAFGADVNVNTGQMRAAIFYAQFQAGAGLDLMLSKGNHSCAGINGWYARGQAYAYVSGDIGITVKLGFIRKDVSIFSGAAGVLLQAGLPNPAWFRGNVMGRYSALGGAVKGSFNLKMALGDECGNSISVTPPNSLPGLANISNTPNSSSGARLASDANVTAEVATPLILSFTPGARDTDTQVDSSDFKEKVIPPVLKYQIDTTTNSVFTIPTITFNQAMESDFTLANSTTGVLETYRVNVTQAILKKGTAIVASTLLWNDNKTVLTIQPNTVLDSKVDYEISVTAQLLKNNVAVIGTDRNIIDTKVIPFRTGGVEFRIPASNIAYMYPVDGQRFLHKSENLNGYIKLSRSQPIINSLLPANRKVKFTSETDSYEVPWTMVGDSINFTLPTGLLTQKKYKFSVSGFKTVDENVVIYEGTFRTSKYPTSAAKWLSVTNPTTAVYKSASQNLTKNTALLYANANMDEWFDEVDLLGNNLTGFKPLFTAKNKLTENYHANVINSLIYPTVFNGVATLSSVVKKEDEVLVSSKYVHYAKNLNQPDSLAKWMPYQYSVTNLIHRDYQSLQGALAAKYVSDSGFVGTATAEYKIKAGLVLTDPVPYLENGAYSIDIFKKTPARTAALAKTFIYNISNLVDTRGYPTYNGSNPPDATVMLITKTFFSMPIQTICSMPLEKIITTSKVLNGAIVRMKAILEITFEEGFETDNDVDLEAETGPCVN